MAELLGTSGIFTGLDNDSLATGEASGKDDNNLSVLNAEKEKKKSKILEEEDIHKVDEVYIIRRNTIKLRDVTVVALNEVKLEPQTLRSIDPQTLHKAHKTGKKKQHKNKSS